MRLCLVLTVVISFLESTQSEKELKESFCGNGIVEKGEECDCGYMDDCEDNCCNPRNSNLSPSADTLKCTLKDLNSNSQMVQCSPFQGPCCSPSCRFLPASEGHVCRPETECIKEGQCDGMNATCPPVRMEQDMKYCNSFTQVCIEGVCQGSLCKRIGYNNYVSATFQPTWDECYINGNSNPNPNEAENKSLCYLACQERNSGTCYASNGTVPTEFQRVIDEVKFQRSLIENQTTVLSRTLCYSSRGFCDVYFKRCSGLKGLKDYILKIKDWIKV